MSPLKSAQEIIDTPIPPLDQRVTTALREKLPTLLLPGDFVPLGGNPNTGEFSQVNAAGLQHFTREEIYSALYNALEGAGAGYKLVSENIKDTRYSAGLLLEDRTQRVSLNLTFNQESGGLNITINKASNKNEQD